MLKEYGYMLSFLSLDFFHIATFAGLLSMPALLAVTAYYKLFIGMRKKIAEIETKLKHLEEKPATAKPKYAKSNPAEEKYRLLAQKIRQYMDAERPYLDMAFSPAQLAQKLDVSPHELSMVMSQHLESSFFEYVNTCRVHYFVAHADRVIHRETTILSLAFESGFNSKSTFNKYFKRVEGMSPGEYLKKEGAAVIL